MARIILKPVLFKEDYYKRPVYRHDTTKNLSALKMALAFKKMGVENNEFILTTFDKDLLNHDPHDLKDNSIELKQRIAQECKLNVWYFLREVVRIPIQGGDPVRYRFDRANISTAWLMLNNIDVFECIPRQRGKTISTQAYVAWMMYISGKNLTLTMLTKGSDLRQINVSRLKDIRNSLPKWMIHSQPSLDTENKEGLAYAALKTTYSTFVAQTDFAGADNLGRGVTTPWMHWDELTTFKNIHITYDVALSCTLAAVESARVNGQPCSNIITSTPGILSTPEGRFTFKIFNEAIPFREIFYDEKNNESLREMISRNSGNDMVLTMYSFLQLGATTQWFKDATRRVADKSTIPREFLLMWDLGTSKGVLTKEKREQIYASKVEPAFNEKVDGFIMNWYIPKVEKEDYLNMSLVMGMDGSENIGKDFSTLVAINPRTLETVFTVRCNESSIPKFSMFIANLLLTFPKMVIIPERQSIGSTVIDICIAVLEKNNINPYTRIFNQVIHNRDKPQFANIRVSGPRCITDGKTRGYFGYRANAGEEGRTFLFKNIMNTIVERYYDRLHDATIIDELVNLEIKNGRIDHSDGRHDDTLMAYLLAAYLLLAGRNLQFYGIDTKLVSSFGKKDDYSEEIDIESIIKQMAKIKSKMDATDNNIMLMSYKQKYNQLESMLRDENVDLSNIDSAIKHASGKDKERPVSDTELIDYMERIIQPMYRQERLLC